jgi:hypothetical protein
MKINFICLASDSHVVEAYKNIYEKILQLNPDVNFIGLSTEDFLNGTGSASKEYVKYNIEYHIIPNPDNISLHEIFEDSVQIFYNFLKSMINRYKPVGFLVANLEALHYCITKIFKKAGVKVFFIEHGYGYAVRRIIASRNISNIKHHLMNRHCEYVKKYKIYDIYFCISDFSHRTFHYKKNVEISGYPYFDSFFSRSNNYKEINKIKKILFISSGHGVAGNLQLAIMFYNTFISYSNILKNNYEIFLRLKPNENINNFLPKSIIIDMSNISFKYDDNTISSNIALDKYDLIIADFSMIIVECILKKIPVCVLEYKNKSILSLMFYKRIIKKLKLETLKQKNDINKILQRAFKPEYVEFTYNNLKKNNKIFGIEDNNASDRIAFLIASKCKLL